MVRFSYNVHTLCRAIISSIPLLYAGCSQVAVVGDDFLELEYNENTEVDKFPSEEKQELPASTFDVLREIDHIIPLVDDLVPEELDAEIDTDSDSIPEWMYGITCDGPPGGEVFGDLDTILYGAEPPPPEQRIFSFGPLFIAEPIISDRQGPPALALYSEKNELLYLGMSCGEMSPGEYAVNYCGEDDPACVLECPSIMHSYVGPTEIYIGKKGLVILDETEDCIAGRFKISYGLCSKNVLTGWFRTRALPSSAVAGNATDLD